MTKKQALARKKAWHLALIEGRVIRYVSWDTELACEQYYFVSYPTKSQADSTLAVQLDRIEHGESIHISANIAPAVIE